jgi:hypothetical protein
MPPIPFKYGITTVAKNNNLSEDSQIIKEFGKISSKRYNYVFYSQCVIIERVKQIIDFI